MAILDKTKTQTPAEISPLDRLAEHAQLVSHMCDLLEALADDLPRRPVPVWREASRLCTDVIPRHYDDVLQVIVPVLMRRTAGEQDCEQILQRLRSDFEDEACRLTELSELLSEAVGTSGQKIGPEALGYALRGFFDMLRRNACWETDVLLPMASRRLNAEDLDQIAGGLSVPKIRHLN